MKNLLRDNLMGQQKALQLRIQHFPSFADFLCADFACGNQLEKGGARDAQITAGFTGVEDPLQGLERGAAAAAVRVDPPIGNPSVFHRDHFFPLLSSRHVNSSTPFLTLFS